MRKLLLSLAVLGTITAMPALVEPAYAAPTMQSAATAIEMIDQGAVQAVQYSYNRREFRRRQELRRRQEIRRRNEFRRRQAARRAYRRGY